MEEQINTFESLGVVPWISKQIKSLGKNKQNKLNLKILTKFYFFQQE